MASQFGVLMLREELVVVDVCDRCVRRGKVSLLGEETWLRGSIDFCRRSSETAWSSAATRGRGWCPSGEVEVYGVG